MYDEKSGMHIFFDFVAGLPQKAARVQVAFCFFVGTEQFGSVQAFGPLETSAEPAAPPPESGKAAAAGQPPPPTTPTVFTYVGMHRLIDGEAGEDVVMVVEVQRVAVVLVVCDLE